MALKRLSTVAETKPASSKSDMPIVKVAGSLVSKFNAAVAAKKEAEANEKEVRSKLVAIGLSSFFELNIETNRPEFLTSIKLQQENELTMADIVAGKKAVDGDGETVRLSFQNKYSACDADTADALFTNLLTETNKTRKKTDQLSINNFMQETLAASFDSKVFMNGPDGAFNQEIYDAYASAIAKTTQDLIAAKKLAANTESPLAVTKKVAPLANFHTERWTVFPTVTAQAKLFEVVSNTVTLTPVKAD